MTSVFLLLGSNLGNRSEFLNQAIETLQARCGKIISASSVYETAAWGKTDQASFLNQVLEMETPLLPDQLLTEIHKIEAAAGRNRTEKWGARELDIDILFFGKQHLNSEQLIVPHPQLQNRRFTLLPLAEIAPDLVHPVLRKTVSELLEICPDELEVQVYKPEL